MKVTQSSIAAKAGVSVSTVSRALSNADGINDDLRRRVMDAAASLGYQKKPNLYNLTPYRLPHRLKNVGLFTMLPAHLDPFHARILAGIEAACKSFELSLSLANIDVKTGKGSFITNRVKQGGFDGLLLMSVDDEALPGQLGELGLPVVFVNTDLPNLAFDSYLPDNWNGALLAMQHLFDHGHRRILHVTHLERTTIQRRFFAYRNFVLEHGLGFDPRLVLDSPLGSQDTYDAMKERLSSSEPDFTAVFCANDSSAVGVMRALQEAGFHVPEDVSVVGFDDRETSAFSAPPLTTVHVDCEHLGKRALQGLIERAMTPDAPCTQVEVRVNLVIRQSVARPR